MANAFKSTTSVWVCDSTGNLNTGGVTVTRVYWIPAAAADDLIISDTSDNAAIVLKAKPGAADPIDFPIPEGRKLPSLKINTIDGGTAYIWLRRLSWAG